METENRLIDANVLLAKKFTTGLSDASGNYYGNADVVFADDIENAQTVDAVEVIRCWDCNHCDPENHHCDHPMSTVAPLSRKPDDFCSYGERKEGADNG